MRVIAIRSVVVIHFSMHNKEFWFFLFFIGFFLFNWPFLDIFNMVLPGYFLIVWGLFIVTIYLGVSLPKSSGRDRDV